MNTQEAVVARHSVRQYLQKAIDPSTVERLKQEVETCNREGGLHLQLVLDEPRAFSSTIAKYGKFSGVTNYLVLVAPKGSDEAVGYYGERIVLLAQTLGLNSCWVGLSYSKQPDHYQIATGEKLYGVIALGYGQNQGVQHPMRKMEQFVKVSGDMPEWFRRGMEAALLAPTAVNQQKFLFELVGPRQVAAYSRLSLVGYAKLDLGIVKYHFEVGAGKENFEWVVG